MVLWPPAVQIHGYPYAGTGVCALTQRGLLTQTKINNVKEVEQETITLHGMDTLTEVKAKRSKENVLPGWEKGGRAEQLCLGTVRFRLPQSH